MKQDADLRIDGRRGAGRQAGSREWAGSEGREGRNNTGDKGDLKDGQCCRND